MKYIVSSLTAIIAVTVLTTSATAQSNLNIESLQSDLMEQEISRLNAPVQSYSDLQNYQLANFKTALDSLPANAKRDFMDSLVFTEKGLASFRYDLLEKHSTPTQIHGVLSMFGLEHGTGQFENAKVETTLDLAILQSYAAKTQSLGDNKTNPNIGNGFDPSDFGGQTSFGSTLSISSPFLENYVCSGKGSCQAAQNHACTSNC